ncbi:hypothetical protein HOP61_04280 [Halomonas daqingensis]|uniref:RiboL-PSP-HEPN domain-containing protein n=1 Tax=Billgrantia desiderata TaxID=52021 RepID=A0AAW4YQF2_9GAMM|nr:HEPN domain-containing protein [Halomonas desiderata]MCE8050504.1 hypothetical protein [Halomonas desiderata]
MSYARSRARISFEKRVGELKNTARSVSYKRDRTSHRVRELVYHAAVFETSAALEEYVIQVFEDYHFSLLGNKNKMKDLPDAVRSYIFFSEIKGLFSNYILTGDERKFLESIDFNGNAFSVTFHDKDYDATINMKKVVDGKKYPSPRNWESLFYRIGLKGIFTRIDPLIKRSSKMMLVSFNDVRTAIAHESPPELNFGDISMHMNNMLVFIRGLDRVLFSHICKATGKSTWPNDGFED